MAEDRVQDFDPFFRNEYGRVTIAAQVILRDPQAAQDAAQEAFARLFRHWDRVSRYDKPEAWVRRVAIRIAVKELRRRRFWTRWTGDTEPPHLDVLYDADLMSAIGRLSPRQQAAVALFYLEDRTTAEIAEILDCSESTAAVHLHRARRKLAGLLSEPERTKEAEGVA